MKKSPEFVLALIGSVVALIVSSYWFYSFGCMSAEDPVVIAGFISNAIGVVLAIISIVFSLLIKKKTELSSVILIIMSAVLFITNYFQTLSIIFLLVAGAIGLTRGKELANNKYKVATYVLIIILVFVLGISYIRIKLHENINVRQDINQEIDSDDIKAEKDVEDQSLDLKNSEYYKYLENNINSNIIAFDDELSKNTDKRMIYINIESPGDNDEEKVQQYINDINDIAKYLYPKFNNGNYLGFAIKGNEIGFITYVYTLDNTLELGSKIINEPYKDIYEKYKKNLTEKYS